MSTIATPVPLPSTAPAAGVAYGPRTSPLPLRVALWTLLGITLFGGVLRFGGLDRLPLWFDEAATFAFASKPAAELWGEALRDEPNPPLYYTLQHYWLEVGHSERSVRALPALIGTLTIPLVGLLGSAVGGRRVGLVAAALLATSPIHLQYSQEARAYGLLMAAAALALWGWVEMLKRPDALRRPDRRLLAAMAAYVLGNTVALYAHNTAVLLTGITGGYALVWWLSRRLGDWRALAMWGAAAVGILALWGWWVPILVQQAQVVSASWHMPHPTPKLAVAELERVYGQAHAWLLRPLLDAAVLAVVGLGVWRWRRQPERLLPLLVIVVGVPVATLLLSLYRPMYVTRTLLWALGPWMVLVACGLWSVQSTRTRWIVVVLAVAAQLWGVARYFAVYEKEEPWDRVLATINEGKQPGDLILVQPTTVLWPVDYYARRQNVPLPRYGVVADARPGRPALVLRTEPVTPHADVPEHAGLGSALAAAPRVWLVVRNSGRRETALPALEALGFRESQRRHFDKLGLRLLERGPALRDPPRVR